LVFATDQTARDGTIWGSDDPVLGAGGLERGQDGTVPGGLLEVAIDVGVKEEDVALGFKAHLLN
jgi:hypothetical protein